MATETDTPVRPVGRGGVAPNAQSAPSLEEQLAALQSQLNAQAEQIGQLNERLTLSNDGDDGDTDTEMPPRGRRNQLVEYWEDASEGEQSNIDLIRACQIGGASPYCYGSTQDFPTISGLSNVVPLVALGGLELVTRTVMAVVLLWGYTKDGRTKLIMHAVGELLHEHYANASITLFVNAMRETDYVQPTDFGVPLKHNGRDGINEVKEKIWDAVRAHEGAAIARLRVHLAHNPGVVWPCLEADDNDDTPAVCPD